MIPEEMLSEEVLRQAAEQYAEAMKELDEVEEALCQM